MPCTRTRTDGSFIPILKSKVALEGKSAYYCTGYVSISQEIDIGLLHGRTRTSIPKYVPVAIAVCGKSFDTKDQNVCEEQSWIDYVYHTHLQAERNTVNSKKDIMVNKYIRVIRGE